MAPDRWPRTMLAIAMGAPSAGLELPWLSTMCADLRLLGLTMEQACELAASESAWNYVCQSAVSRDLLENGSRASAWLLRRRQRSLDIACVLATD